MTAETIQRTQPRAAVPRAASTAIQICRCGHELDAHEHHRPGSDCGACGATRCRGYRRRTARAARSSFLR